MIRNMPFALTLTFAVSLTTVAVKADNKNGLVVENHPTGPQESESKFVDPLPIGGRIAQSRQNMVKALSSIIERGDGTQHDYLMRGRVYVKLNQKFLAVQDFQKALELEPGNEEARKLLNELFEARINLNSWSQEGYSANGRWEVSADGQSVVQQINRSPTFFVSPDTFIDTTIRGRFKVETTDDDDFIGFVIGYRSPLKSKKDSPAKFDFLLFDWKQASQSNAFAGFALVRVKGSFEYEGGGDGGHDVPGLWDHSQSTSTEVLGTSYGDDLGWKDKTEHQFELVYTRKKITIRVDGRKVIEADGDFPAGRFGFYNYSQAKVRYTGFTRAALKPPGLLRITTPDEKIPAAMMQAVELIVDSSTSMSEKVRGVEKSKIAKSTLLKVLRSIVDSKRGYADRVHLGVRLFGHRGQTVLRRENPNAPLVAWNDRRLNTDSELVLKVGLLNEKRLNYLLEWIKWMEPRGKTPLVYSLLEARNDLPADLKMRKVIVLITDGQDTCGGNLNDVAKAYEGSDIETVIHVVGFDVDRDPEAKRQLQQIARIGKGRYFNASDGDQLANALLSAIGDGTYEVIEPASRQVVAHGSINEDPVLVNPGLYVVRLRGSEVKPVQAKVSSGGRVEIQLNQSKLKVLAQ